jgi:hypothetical protein
LRDCGRRRNQGRAPRKRYESTGRPAAVLSTVPDGSSERSASATTCASVGAARRSGALASHGACRRPDKIDVIVDYARSLRRRVGLAPRSVGIRPRASPSSKASGCTLASFNSSTGRRTARVEGQGREMSAAGCRRVPPRQDEISAACWRSRWAGKTTSPNARWSGKYLRAMSSPPFSSVFVSSIQSGFEDERAAAREGIESFGSRALMAETAGAAPASPRDALLELVEDGDVFLLIVGPRYGEVGASGRSPTEDEFDYARSLGKDILVLVYDGPRDRAVEEFLRRVQGTWEKGYYAPRFNEAAQVVGLTVRSLRELAERRLGGVAAPEAQDRAVKFAAGDRRGSGTSGSRLRVALVPVGSPTLLDAVRSDDAALIDRLAGALRTASLVPHAAGIETQVTTSGVSLHSSQSRVWQSTDAAISADGAVWVELDVAATGLLGSGQVDHSRVMATVAGASRFAQIVWEELDCRGQVRQVAAAIGVPDAQGKLYVMRSTGNSSRVPMGGPGTIVVPQSALLLRREDVGVERIINQLVMSLKRAFADHGALNE